MPSSDEDNGHDVLTECNHTGHVTCGYMGLANEETDMLATGTPPKREEVVRLWDVVYT